jgi:hypothetical protein
VLHLLYEFAPPNKRLQLKSDPSGGERRPTLVEVFPIIPASAKPIWLLAAVCILLTAILFALAYTAYSARHSRFEVADGQFNLVGDFWARSIPIESIRTEQAEILDLTKQSEYAPKRRTFGTGLPGYASGWFRLKNGDSALAYLTLRESVVYLPTSLGYSLLLSAERPQELVAALRSQVRH